MSSLTKSKTAAEATALPEVLAAPSDTSVEQLAQAWTLGTAPDLWPTLRARLEAEQHEQPATPPTQTAGDGGGVRPPVKTALATGDESFDRFQRDHEAHLYAWFLNQTKDEDIAADLTVETYLRAYREWSTHSATNKDWPWLLEIAQELLGKATSREAPSTHPSELATALAMIHQELQGLREDNKLLRREEVERQRKRPGEGVQLLPYAPKSDFNLPLG